MTAIRPKPSQALAIALLAIGLAIVGLVSGVAQADTEGAPGPTVTCPDVTVPPAGSSSASVSCSYSGPADSVTGWEVDGFSQGQAGSASANLNIDHGAHTVTVQTTDLITPSVSNGNVVVDTPPSIALTPSGDTTAALCDPVGFDASGTSDADGDPLSFGWAADGSVSGFGDPATFAPSFSSPGGHTVNLLVNDTFQASSASRNVTVVDGAPSSHFTANPGGPLVGQKVSFDASTSTDADNTSAHPNCDSLKYSWDLNGDNKFGDSTSKKPSTTYASPGTVNVTLRVTDRSGVVSTSSAPINVGANTPTPVTSSQPPTDPGATPTQPASIPLVFPPVARATLMSPFPVIRIRGRLTSRGVVISLLTVRAPRGALVTAKCRGRGCPRKTLRAHASRKGVVRLRKLERRLRAGVKITIYVTQKGRIGKYTRFTILKGKAPARRDLCTNGSKAAKCPAG